MSRRISTGLLPMLGLFVLLMVSLYLMSDVTENAARFGRLYLGLLVLNSLLLALLTGLIGMNLFALIGQVAKREAGSRLTLRLMLMFVVLATVPVAIVYTFSIKFLDRGIDSWFDVRIEQALDDSLNLSRSSLDLLTLERRRQTERMIEELVDIPEPMAPLVLNDLLNSGGAIELTLFDSNNRIIASSSELSAAMVPRLPDESIMRLLSQGQGFVGLTPTGDDTLQVRLVLPIPGSQVDTSARSLQAIYPVPERINALAGNVQEAYGKFHELTYLRTPLKQSFTLTLSLVLLLSVLFAVWAAFYSSRRLMSPIRELADGTRHVAAGEFNRKLPVGRRDDLGQLVESFNQMTDRLSAARDSAELSQQLVEEHRTYLQRVLENLSSGVLTLDQKLVLRTANATASQILDVELDVYVGRELADIGVEHPALEHFCDGLGPLMSNSDGDWQEQIVFFGNSGRKVLICRGTPLPDRADLQGGHVIVFDDVTELIQAQRDAAWGEVARRLAHEIKNPLTPIQLSAERMNKKLSNKLEPDDAKLLERSTHTIVQQVESMKTMVDAFSEYARLPAMDTAPVNLTKLIREVSDLYPTRRGKAKLVLNLDENTPHIDADAVRMRQVLHNLIKNAFEALQDAPRAWLEIVTRGTEEDGRHFVHLMVCDNGPGFPEDFMDRLFEPYVTSKTKGNGLGLAIVKKIIEEHSGMVWAQNSDDGGAVIHIRLPATSTGLRSEKIDIRGTAA